MGKKWIDYLKQLNAMTFTDDLTYAKLNLSCVWWAFQFGKKTLSLNLID